MNEYAVVALLSAIAVTHTYALWRLRRLGQQNRSTNQKNRKRIESLEAQLAAMPTAEDLLAAIPDVHKAKLTEVFERTNVLSKDLLEFKKDYAPTKAAVQRMAKTTKWGQALGVEGKEE